MSAVEHASVMGECPSCATGRVMTRRTGDADICPASGHWLCEAPPLRQPQARCTSRCPYPYWVPIDPKATPRKVFELVLE